MSQGWVPFPAEDIKEQRKLMSSPRKERKKKKKTIPELPTPIKPPQNKVQKATFAFEFTTVAFRVNILWAILMQVWFNPQDRPLEKLHCMYMLWLLVPYKLLTGKSPQRPYEGTGERQSLPRLHPANWQSQKSRFLTLQSNEIAGIWDRKRLQIQSLISIKQAAVWAIFKKLGSDEAEFGATTNWCQERPHLHFKIYVFCNLLLHIKVPYSCKGRFFLPLKFMTSCSKLQRRLVWSSVS